MRKEELADILQNKIEEIDVSAFVVDKEISEANTYELIQKIKRDDLKVLGICLKLPFGEPFKKDFVALCYEKEGKFQWVLFHRIKLYGIFASAYNSYELAERIMNGMGIDF